MIYGELDRCIEDAARMTLGTIFTVRGESYYRRLGREALARLFYQKRSFTPYWN